MRRFFRRLNHRDAVMRNLDALLLLYPRGRQFPRDFPTLKATIRSDFETGVPPTVSALRISGGVIGSFVGQLGDDQKARVLAALVEHGRAHYAVIALRRVKGPRVKAWREPVRDPVLFVSELAGAAIYIAGRMAEEGTIRWDEYADFLTNIETALGVSPKDQQPLGRAFAP
jgi:hypothetical protein